MTARNKPVATQPGSEDAVEGLRQAVLRLASPRLASLQDDIEALQNQLARLSHLEEGLAGLQSQLDKSDQNTLQNLQDLNALLQQARDQLTEIEGGLSQLDASVHAEIQSQTKALDANLAELQSELVDRQAISDRIHPVLVPVLSEHARENQDRLAHAVSPVMGPAIRHQIRNARQDIIDSLYPVIGQIINKAVSESTRELTRNIDERLRQQLDLQSQVRRISGRLRGIPEAELFLRDALPYQVNHVFLVHRKNGLLLHHLTPMEEHREDMDLISGMLTAIRDFVRDSFGQGEGELEEITHGDQRILLEGGQYAYLAVVVDGVEPSGYSNLIRAVVNEINVQHEVELLNFEGDMGGLPDFQPTLSMLLAPTFDQLQQVSQPAELSRSQKLSIFATILAAILIPVALIFLCIFVIRLWPVAFPEMFSFGAPTLAPSATVLPAVLPSATLLEEPEPSSTPTATPTTTPTLIPSPTVTHTPVPSLTPTLEPAPETGTLGRLEGTLNLRTGPSTDFPVQGVIFTGEQVRALREQDGWLFIHWPAEGEPVYEGWVWGGLVTLEEPPE